MLKNYCFSGEKLPILLSHKSESQKSVFLSTSVISGDPIYSSHLAQILLVVLCQVVDGSLWCEKKIKKTSTDTFVKYFIKMSVLCICLFSFVSKLIKLSVDLLKRYLQKLEKIVRSLSK